MPQQFPAAVLTDLLPDRSASAEATRFARDVFTGLSDSPKHLSSQYFYDENGMRLFQEIMEMPEYYLTSCEHNIFAARREQINAAIPAGPLNVLDLGSGDGRKTRILLEHFLPHRHGLKYFPLDISHDTLHLLIDSLKRDMPSLAVHAVAAEYFDALQWIGEHQQGRNLVLFLGSNIGNFSPDRARVFLRRLHDALRPGDFALIGFDLKKDPRTISRAYDDAAGVTARFNCNLLARINRELGGDFDIDAFQHYAYYDANSGAAQSFLVSTMAQRATIQSLNTTFSFDAWECIHTEDSWKYSPRDIAAFAQECGFSIVQNFTDDEVRFVDSLWEVTRGS